LGGRVLGLTPQAIEGRRSATQNPDVRRRTSGVSVLSRGATAFDSLGRQPQDPPTIDIRRAPIWDARCRGQTRYIGGSSVLVIFASLDGSTFQ